MREATSKAVSWRRRGTIAGYVFAALQIVPAVILLMTGLDSDKPFLERESFQFLTFVVVTATLTAGLTYMARNTTGLVIPIVVLALFLLTFVAQVTQQGLSNVVSLLIYVALAFFMIQGIRARMVLKRAELMAPAVT